VRIVDKGKKKPKGHRLNSMMVIKDARHKTKKGDPDLLFD
jgi:hypothetical protein